MKKILSLLLCLALLASIGLTALAADTTDSALTERLTAVTLKVKDTLGIADSFTSFNGNLNENGANSLWSLSWSRDNEQLYVTANENGTVISYSDSIAGISTPAVGRIPRFPALSLDDAKAIADAFLAKVLDTKIASVNLTGSSSLDYSGTAVYYLYAPMKLYGIETPVSISVSVSAATKQVISYYRGDAGQDYSGVTNPSAAFDKAAAAAKLKGTLNMKMTYALPGDGTHTARLQYLPNPKGSFVVDAATGKLVDLSTLDFGSDIRNPQANKSDSASSAAPASGSAVITPVEQTTIDKLQGVLPQSELEKNVRAYPELGLNADYVLKNVTYSTYEDDKKVTKVTANLQFTSAPADASAQYRYITMDAKTGKLISVSSNIIYYADTKGAAPAAAIFTDSQTEAVARAFAGKILPDELKLTALSDQTNGTAGTDSTRTYTYNRMNADVAFPENAINVGVNADSGFVVSFYYNWYDYEVTFPSPSGAISADTAAAKYADGAGIALRYVSVPTSLQPSGLLLAYTTADANVWGVNALTGELLKATAAVDTGLKYDDLDGNTYAAVINKLALYGVGFSGGSFKPDAQLTQLDALILIESTNGRKVMPLANPSPNDDIYSTAYAMGILTPAEKNPTKPVSRVEFVKYLVNALGYNEVAVLTGIYEPGFKDDKSIPADLVGYAAIAKGLGIIRGDQTGKLRPNEIATRTQAAIMVYNCMSRK